MGRRANPLLCLPVQEGVAEKNVLGVFGRGESELASLIRLRRIRLIHRSSGCM